VVRKKASKKMKLGPTGDFPDGRLNEYDEGGINMVVEVSKGRVLLSFGKPIAWLGVSPDDALRLADLLTKHAKQAKETMV
jgi:hypothetical protein